ncbi:MAG: protein kinase [Bryobacteraceae bacterium]|nr:protein kinase [Bryobacteraceae bacterium]
MEQIGRYQIQGELGRGAMGVVYRALDPAIGRIIAIKTIHLSTLTDPQDRERMHDRLKREAQSAGILSHPNIVTIYDIQDQGDTAYIFMEFVDGPTLESITQDRRAPSPATLLALLKQIAAALDFAHSKGIVHRDVKPANIMIQGERIAKVTDFGIARINAQASVSSGATVAGTLLGTPNYMSPEQIQGEAVDGRADQFSLAVLTYELLTGEKPFTADSIPALIYKILNLDPPPAERLNASLHPEAAAALTRGMAKPRERRFATCVEFVEALELGLARQPQWQALPRGASDSAPTVVTPPPPPEPAPVLPEPRIKELREEAERQKGGRLLKLAGAAAGIAVLVAAGVVFWAQHTDFAPPPAPAPVVDTPPTEVKPPEPKPPEPKPVDQKPAEAKPAEVKPPEPKPEPATQPQSGGLTLYKVTLRSQPDGATAVLESGRGCRTPCEIQVPAGRHTVTFTSEGFTSRTERFETPTQDSVMSRLDANTGTVFVDSNPSGASIRVDGKEVSAKTPTQLVLPAGKHKLDFSKDGYASQQHDVDVVDGAISRLSIRWSEKK